MKRRSFLKAAAALPLVARAAGADETSDRLKEFTITEVTGFRHTCPRPKFIGKNSHLDDHGDRTSEDCLRIKTDQGLEGIGVGRATPEAARRVLGMTLDQLWDPETGAVGPLGRSDHPVFDLVGKALGVPAWTLLGGHGPEWVDVYDGSIYFNDLLDGPGPTGIGRILTEVGASLEAGHRALKIKVGRGFKWMPREEGFRRDVEVVQAIRRRVGPGVELMIDANNGFDLDGAIRFLDTVGLDLLFVEEMFPEKVDEDLELMAWLREKGWLTKVADGESATDVDHFKPFLDFEALDVLQPDIRAFGLTKLWALSRLARPKRQVRLAAHNWGSFLGLYMQGVLGRGLGNVLMCEQDPSTSDLFDTSAYEFKEGKLRVPDLPGCGLALREDVFNASYRKDAWTVRQR